MQYGRELGLEGRELQKFIETQQSIEREERAENRRVELAKLEFQVAIEKEKKEVLEKRAVANSNSFRAEERGGRYVV